MITPPTKSFFIIRAFGEASDLIVSELFDKCVADIDETLIVSKDFKTDIEAINSMDLNVESFKKQLISNVQSEITHNPLYIPSTQLDIDKVLESDDEGSYKFIGMNQNPFSIKHTSLHDNQNQILSATAECYKFELPTYSEIIDSLNHIKIN